MKIARKRAEPVKETQMVSLADIAFLIIFFFLLTSSFMTDKAAVALPTLVKTSQTKSAIIVRMDSEAKIFLNGELMADQNVLESQLRNLLAGRTKPEDLEVRFKCEKNLKYKNYRPIYEAIANAGGIIAIVHDLPKRG